MWNAENNHKGNFNAVELDGEFVIVTDAQDEEFEREILEKRPAHGRVRWFKRSLGYGFLREDGDSTEVFVHQASIQVPGTKALRPGQRVVFERCKIKDGEMALNVIPIEENPQKLANYKQKA